MSFVPLVQAWEASREERTPLPGRQRVASIEYGESDVPRPPTFLEWLLDRDRDEPQTENELEDEIDDEEREIG